MPLNAAWILNSLLNVFSLVLMARILLSWIPASPGGLVSDIADVVFAMTEPLLAPIRKLIPPIAVGMGYLDLSPLILMLLISLIRRMLY